MAALTRVISGKNAQRPGTPWRDPVPQETQPEVDLSHRGPDALVCRSLFPTAAPAGSMPETPGAQGAGFVPAPEEPCPCDPSQIQCLAAVAAPQPGWRSGDGAQATMSCCQRSGHHADSRGFVAVGTPGGCPAPPPRVRGDWEGPGREEKSSSPLARTSGTSPPPFPIVSVTEGQRIL